MWCSTCQQDVAECAIADGGMTRCEKCSTVLRGEDSEQPIVATETKQPIAAKEQPIAAVSPAGVEQPTLITPLAAAPLLDDDWTLEADLRNAERLIHSLKTAAPTAADALSFHAPHANTLAQAHFPVAASGNSSIHRSDNGEEAVRTGQNLAWGLLSLSVAALACGAVLLVWSMLANRPDLWPLGMPLTLIGQAGFVIGLVWQLSGIGQSSRTTKSVHQLDRELAEMHHATALLNSRTSAVAGQTFYAHLAEGASPQMLLADLKGQLDLLTQQMNRR